MSQPMDALHQARPEILGGTIAIDADGSFTQTVAFTDEDAARTGESQGDARRDARRRWSEEISVMQDVHYLDLHHPWFASGSTGAGRA